MLPKLRIGLGLLVLAISILFLVWGTWPVHRETRIRPVSFPSGMALPEKRILTLTYPPRLRAGEVGVVRMTLGVDEQGNLAPTAPAGGETQGSGSPDIYQTHKVTAEARFDIPGLSVRPSDLISAPLARGQTAVFYWTLRPRDLEKGRGTIWLYLRTVDRQTGQERRETVSAQLIEMESVKFLGLAINQVRMLGLAGFVLGFFLSMPLFGALLRNKGGKRPVIR